MAASTGHIELERTIDSIVVGSRHRVELGDIDALAASIERDGLLQPPTVTPEGVLVCGARRIAALRKLGYKKVNVFVRSGISDRLQRLMAEQADNVLHKPFTQTEAAALYRELKTLMAEDAARRQAATQFGAGWKIAGTSGGAVTAPPLIAAIFPLAPNCVASCRRVASSAISTFSSRYSAAASICVNGLCNTLSACSAMSRCSRSEMPARTNTLTVLYPSWCNAARRRAPHTSTPSGVTVGGCKSP